MSNRILTTSTAAAESNTWVSPWGSFTRMPEGMSAADAIAHAGLDWQVGLRPTYALIDNDEKKLVKVPDKRTVVRLDTSDPLGIVGTRYQPIQNRHAFAYLDGIVEDGSIEIASAGTDRSGAVVWVLARMPGADFTIGGEDRSEGYMLFRTSHDGSGSATVALIHNRIACSNAVSRAIATSKKKLSIRHSGDVRANLRTAQDALRIARKQSESLQEMGDALLARMFTPSERDAFVEALIPSPVALDADALAALDVDARRKAEASFERARTRAQNRQNGLLGMLDHPTNKVGQMEGSWWSLFNAATAYADHEVSGKEGTNEMSRRLWGSGADFKAKAEGLALAVVS